jgi:hypothetical protein
VSENKGPKKAEYAAILIVFFLLGLWVVVVALRFAVEMVTGIQITTLEAAGVLVAAAAIRYALSWLLRKIKEALV